jgi:hypothetical protein
LAGGGTSGAGIFREVVASTALGAGPSLTEITISDARLTLSTSKLILSGAYCTVAITLMFYTTLPYQLITFKTRLAMRR